MFEQGLFVDDIAEIRPGKDTTGFRITVDDSKVRFDGVVNVCYFLHWLVSTDIDIGCNWKRADSLS